MYNEGVSDSDLIRRFAVRLGDYLPAELIKKLDLYCHSGTTSADYILSVEVIEQKLPVDWSIDGRIECSYLCSVRIYDPPRKYYGNIFKDWFRTEPEKDCITKVSVTRAKELLGKLLNPWELVHIITKGE